MPPKKKAPAPAGKAKKAPLTRSRTGGGDAHNVVVSTQKITKSSATRKAVRPAAPVGASKGQAKGTAVTRTAARGGAGVDEGSNSTIPLDEASNTTAVLDPHEQQQQEQAGLSALLLQQQQLQQLQQQQQQQQQAVFEIDSATFDSLHAYVAQLLASRRERLLEELRLAREREKAEAESESEEEDDDEEEESESDSDSESDEDEDDSRANQRRRRRKTIRRREEKASSSPKPPTSPQTTLPPTEWDSNVSFEESRDLIIAATGAAGPAVSAPLAEALRQYTRCCGIGRGGVGASTSSGGRTRPPPSSSSARKGKDGRGGGGGSSTASTDPSVASADHVRHVAGCLHALLAETEHHLCRAMLQIVPHLFLDNNPNFLSVVREQGATPPMSDDDNDNDDADADAMVGNVKEEGRLGSDTPGAVTATQRLGTAPVKARSSKISNYSDYNDDFERTFRKNGDNDDDDAEDGSGGGGGSGRTAGTGAGMMTRSGAAAAQASSNNNNSNNTQQQKPQGAPAAPPVAMTIHEEVFRYLRSTLLFSQMLAHRSCQVLWGPRGSGKHQLLRTLAREVMAANDHYARRVQLEEAQEERDGDRSGGRAAVATGGDGGAADAGPVVVFFLDGDLLNSDEAALQSMARQFLHFLLSPAGRLSLMRRSPAMRHGTFPFGELFGYDRILAAVAEGANRNASGGGHWPGKHPRASADSYPFGNTNNNSTANKDGRPPAKRGRGEDTDFFDGFHDDDMGRTSSSSDADGDNDDQGGEALFSASLADMTETTAFLAGGATSALPHLQELLLSLRGEFGVHVLIVIKNIELFGLRCDRLLYVLSGLMHNSEGGGGTTDRHGTDDDSHFHSRHHGHRQLNSNSGGTTTGGLSLLLSSSTPDVKFLEKRLSSRLTSESCFLPPLSYTWRLTRLLRCLLRVVRDEATLLVDGWDLMALGVLRPPRSAAAAAEAAAARRRHSSAGWRAMMRALGRDLEEEEDDDEDGADGGRRAEDVLTVSARLALRRMVRLVSPLLLHTYGGGGGEAAGELAASGSGSGAAHGVSHPGDSLPGGGEGLDDSSDGYEEPISWRDGLQESASRYSAEEARNERMEEAPKSRIERGAPGENTRASAVPLTQPLHPKSSSTNADNLDASFPHRTSGANDATAHSSANDSDSRARRQMEEHASSLFLDYVAHNPTLPLRLVIEMCNDLLYELDHYHFARHKQARSSGGGGGGDNTNNNSSDDDSGNRSEFIQVLSRMSDELRGSGASLHSVRASLSLLLARLFSGDLRMLSRSFRRYIAEAALLHYCAFYTRASERQEEEERRRRRRQRRRLSRSSVNGGSSVVRTRRQLQQQQQRTAERERRRRAALSPSGSAPAEFSAAALARLFPRAAPMWPLGSEMSRMVKQNGNVDLWRRVMGGLRHLLFQESTSAGAAVNTYGGAATASEDLLRLPTVLSPLLLFTQEASRRIREEAAAAARAAKALDRYGGASPVSAALTMRAALVRPGGGGNANSSPSSNSQTLESHNAVSTARPAHTLRHGRVPPVLYARWDADMADFVERLAACAAQANSSSAFEAATATTASKSTARAIKGSSAAGARVASALAEAPPPHDVRCRPDSPFLRPETDTTTRAPSSEGARAEEYALVFPSIFSFPSALRDAAALPHPARVNSGTSSSSGAGTGAGGGGGWGPDSVFHDEANFTLMAKCFPKEAFLLLFQLYVHSDASRGPGLARRSLVDLIEDIAAQHKEYLSAGGSSTARHNNTASNSSNSASGGAKVSETVRRNFRDAARLLQRWGFVHLTRSAAGGGGGGGGGASTSGGDALGSAAAPPHVSGRQGTTGGGSAANVLLSLAIRRDVLREFLASVVMPSSSSSASASAAASPLLDGHRHSTGGGGWGRVTAGNFAETVVGLDASQIRHLRTIL